MTARYVKRWPGASQHTSAKDFGTRSAKRIKAAGVFRGELDTDEGCFAGKASAYHGGQRQAGKNRFQWEGVLCSNSYSEGSTELKLSRAAAN